ncbi:MAG: MarR family transcriptional regulator [Microlunatus sp.]|nr:MarR family transcriptional regulator [Microlunatus sp.]
MATQKLTELEDSAWRGFLFTHDRIWREVEANLAPLNVSMAEYSVLALLAEAGRQGMRMSDLAQRRVMSIAGFSRLADRLERRGLIERRRSAADGRGFEVVLTAAGRALLRKAWRQQHGDLRRLFFDQLDQDDLRHLAEIWTKLDPDRQADRVSGSRSSPGPAGPASPDSVRRRAR